MYHAIIGIIHPILLLLFVGTSRALARLWLSEQYQNLLKKAKQPKFLIYGAGESGRQLARAMSGNQEMQVVGFLDDDNSLHGHVLNGQTIYNPADLSKLAKSLNIKDVLLAMPSISRKRKNEILNQIQEVQVSVRTLPTVSDLAKGKVTISDLKELDIDDLLGREAVIPNQILLAKKSRIRLSWKLGLVVLLVANYVAKLLNSDPKNYCWWNRMNLPCIIFTRN